MILIDLFDMTGLNRKNIVDTRVHCCLYFIPPYGHGLRQIDLEFLKRLQYKVNLVPVIGKADTLTKPEVYSNDLIKSIDIRNDFLIFSMTIEYFLSKAILPIVGAVKSQHQ